MKNESEEVRHYVHGIGCPKRRFFCWESVVLMYVLSDLFDCVDHILDQSYGFFLGVGVVDNAEHFRLCGGDRRISLRTEQNGIRLVTRREIQQYILPP